MVRRAIVVPAILKNVQHLPANNPAQSPPVGTAVPLPNGRPGVSAKVTVAHLPTRSALARIP
jgi:hypothetical protein